MLDRVFPLLKYWYQSAWWQSWSSLLFCWLRIHTCLCETVPEHVTDPVTCRLDHWLTCSACTSIGLCLLTCLLQHTCHTRGWRCGLVAYLGVWVSLSFWLWLGESSFDDACDSRVAEAATTHHIARLVNHHDILSSFLLSLCLRHRRLVIKTHDASIDVWCL